MRAEVAGEVAAERARRAVRREDPRVLDLVLRADRGEVLVVGRVEPVDVLEALVDLAVVAGLAGGVERVGGRRCGGGQCDGDDPREPPLPEAHERERTTEPESGAPVASGDMNASEKPEITVPDGPPSYQLELEDLTVGDGEEATSGRIVEVHYVGVSWQTGNQFDASWDRGDTFKFGLGSGQVIPGWDQGVAGMKVGGRRRITIPPDLAYGKRGAGGVIGPDETLIFVVDLVDVR